MIAYDNDTGFVFYKGDLFFKNGMLHGPDFMDSRRTPDDTTLLDAPPPTPWFGGGGWMWDGTDFTLTAYGEAQMAEYQAQEVARISANIVADTQARLDAFAKTRNYDGILSAASYAVSSNVQFAAEGRYCADARDATWAALYTIMAEVQGGTRPMPTGYADIEADLPALGWPS